MRPHSKEEAAAAVCAEVRAAGGVAEAVKADVRAAFSAPTSSVP